MRVHSVLLLCLITTTAFVAGREKLRFKYSQTNKILLSWDETWEVGAPNMMAFLMPDKKLTIKIALDGNQGVAYKAILKFKCNQAQSDFSAMDLITVASSSSEKQCASEIPFSVRTLSIDAGEYEFTLLPSTLTADMAFSKKLQLAVLIETSSGNLESNSLFVWNLDILSQMNERPHPGKSYAQRFLTSEAIDFLKVMTMPAGQNFGRLNFLDPQVSSLIRGAPAFLRAKINLGAVLNFDAGSCESYYMSRAALFVNYHSQLDERTQNLLKHMHLNVDTGVLHYSAYGISSAITDFFTSKSPSRIGICASLSFAGQRQPYDRTLSVEQRIPSNLLSYKTFGSKDAGCQIPDDMAIMPITIFAGMDYTPLVCPIVCSDPNEVYRFTHVSVDHKEVPLVPAGNKDWTEIDGIRVSKTGNIIEFPPTSQNRHGGQYKCTAGGKTFTFNVQIIAMPQFTTRLYGATSTEISGNLPPAIYAMEGESMSYSCTTYFGNVDRVDIEPIFYSPSTTSDSKDPWRQLTLPDFNSLLVGSPPTPIEQPVVMDPVLVFPDNRTLKVTVKVPPAKTSTGLNFTHRFGCRVTVGPSDAAKMGMQDYMMQTGSNVFYIPRLTLDSFDMSEATNCTSQKCTTASGASFVVSLKPELTAYLKAIGVEVVAMFKIDADYVTDMNIIAQKGVSDSSFDKNSNRVSFKVLPITDAKVLEELRKRKTLTPVFNLRYPDSMKSKLSNLRLTKEIHGLRDVRAGNRDCRNDANCFYSTEFDMKTTLQRLVIGIDFKGQPIALDQTTASEIFLSHKTASTSVIIFADLAAVILLLTSAALFVLLVRRGPGEPAGLVGAVAWQRIPASQQPAGA